MDDITSPLPRTASTIDQEKHTARSKSPQAFEEWPEFAKCEASNPNQDCGTNENIHSKVRNLKTLMNVCNISHPMIYKICATYTENSSTLGEAYKYVTRYAKSDHSEYHMSECIAGQHSGTSRTTYYF
jgi:hypothetical protein